MERTCAPEWLCRGGALPPPVTYVAHCTALSHWNGELLTTTITVPWLILVVLISEPPLFQLISPNNILLYSRFSIHGHILLFAVKRNLMIWGGSEHRDHFPKLRSREGKPIALNHADVNGRSEPGTQTSWLLIHPLPIVLGCIIVPLSWDVSCPGHKSGFRWWQWNAQSHLQTSILPRGPCACSGGSEQGSMGGPGPWP